MVSDGTKLSRRPGCVCVGIGAGMKWGDADLSVYRTSEI